MKVAGHGERTRGSGQGCLLVDRSVVRTARTGCFLRDLRSFGIFTARLFPVSFGELRICSNARPCRRHDIARISRPRPR